MTAIIINLDGEENTFNIANVPPDRIELWVHEFTERVIAGVLEEKNKINWGKFHISVGGALSTMPHLLVSLHTFSLFYGTEVTPDELWSMIVGAES